MNKFLKSALAVCAVVPCAFTFGACKDNKDEHQHIYSQEWTTSDTHHWNGSACGHDGQVASYQEHNYSSNVDMLCDVCGYDRAEYDVWNAQIPSVRPVGFEYDLDNRYIYINNASAFAYFAWNYDMEDEYEARAELIETARINNELDSILAKGESSVEGENCFKFQSDWTIILNVNVDLDNNTVAPMQHFNFRGFEGQNHIIKNFTISNSEDTATGLFAKLDAVEGSIGFNDLVIKNSTILATNAQPAGIIGESYIEINNVHGVDVEIIGLSNNVGAICGKAYSSISNCTATNIDITGVEFIGGIVGYIQANEGAGAVVLQNLYVKNAKISNINEVNDDKVAAIVGGAQRSSTQKLDSLTIKNSNSFEDVTTLNGEMTVTTNVLGRNVGNTCIVR